MYPLYIHGLFLETKKYRLEKVLLKADSRWLEALSSIDYSSSLYTHCYPLTFVLYVYDTLKNLMNLNKTRISHDLAPLHSQVHPSLGNSQSMLVQRTSPPFRPPTGALHMQGYFKQGPTAKPRSICDCYRGTKDCSDMEEGKTAAAHDKVDIEQNYPLKGLMSMSLFH